MPSNIDDQFSPRRRDLREDGHQGWKLRQLYASQASLQRGQITCVQPCAVSQRKKNRTVLLQFHHFNRTQLQFNQRKKKKFTNQRLTYQCLRCDGLRRIREQIIQRAAAPRQLQRPREGPSSWLMMIVMINICSSPFLIGIVEKPVRREESTLLSECPIETNLVKLISLDRRRAYWSRPYRLTLDSNLKFCLRSV